MFLDALFSLACIVNIAAAITVVIGAGIYFFEEKKWIIEQKFAARRQFELYGLEIEKIKLEIEKLKKTRS